ncbi:putative retrotransposon hot spot protein (RHS,) [Trypanosoma cruzi]|uniref:Putative retrotransposon hot spot protein (RHS,) n=1 Tax=Trypanosoma cruzi TaxID=5693 RepID=A0A2V2UMK9_TRYCR|nr:putative retrotransposon hot spot protein (RHS,) [Trypanosoma cruzi]
MSSSKTKCYWRTIEASPPCQELKKEREEFYMLLEASNKLKKEYIVTLRHWSNFERKDTVTPLARAQISTACSQVLRDERRKAEERERRERQELGIDVSTRLKYAVFKGRVRVDKMKLNDFPCDGIGRQGRFARQSGCLAGGVFQEPQEVYLRCGSIERSAGIRSLQEDGEGCAGRNGYGRGCKQALQKWCGQSTEVVGGCCGGKGKCS